MVHFYITLYNVRKGSWQTSQIVSLGPGRYDLGSFRCICTSIHLCLTVDGGDTLELDLLLQLIKKGANNPAGWFFFRSICTVGSSFYESLR